MHEILLGAPHPRLRPFVSRYAEFSELAPGPVGALETASPNVVMVIDFADGWRIEQGGAGGTFGSFVGGLHDGPTFVEHPGRSHGVQLDLSPPGARALLGLPLAELGHAVVGLEDLLGPAVSELLERLHDTPGPGARFPLLDEFLLARAAASAPPRPDVLRAWERLRQTDGSVAIGALADELSCSRRHLSASFRAEFGLSPKAYARVMRFRRATALLVDGVELARVAAVCGYADQPHLNREFRALAARTPGTFVQDATSPVA